MGRLAARASPSDILGMLWEVSKRDAVLKLDEWNEAKLQARKLSLDIVFL